MMFEVAAESYDRYMGRYSVLLAPQMADLARLREGQRALDVGCGPGALTAELALRLGPAAVTAVDPSAPFVEAARNRNPGVTILQAPAEQLPFPDATFDAAIAQLVVHFMADPVAGLAEMARVTRRGGTVAACVWDYGGGNAPPSPFWRVVREFEPDVADESRRPGARQGHLLELFQSAGLHDIGETIVSADVEHATFEDWWEPFTGGVGPAGAYVARLDADRQVELRDRIRAGMPPAPFTLRARAWAVRGVA